MPVMRDNPYGAFKFLVSLGGTDEASVVGGFSDVSGLGTEISYSLYRNGNDKLNTVRKLPNTYKNDDVTLKRGLIGSTDLMDWVRAVQQGEDGRRTVLITMLDEAHDPVATFILRNAQPKKWVGPALAAKGGGEVAMEELHLVHEGLEYQ